MKRFAIAMFVVTLFAPGLTTLTAQGNSESARANAPGQNNETPGRGERNGQHQLPVATVSESGSTALLLVGGLMGVLGVGQLIHLLKRRRSL